MNYILKFIKKKNYNNYMIFFNFTKLSFIKYFNFSARSNRSEYNYWFLFTFLAGSILSLLDMFFSLFLSSLFSLIVLIPSLSVSVRRLHDINKSGWWIFFPVTVVILFTFSYLVTFLINNIFIVILIIFISFMPLFLFIYWTSLKAGDQKNNSFGPPTK